MRQGLGSEVWGLGGCDSHPGAPHTLIDVPGALLRALAEITWVISAQSLASVPLWCLPELGGSVALDHQEVLPAPTQFWVLGLWRYKR